LWLYFRRKFRQEEKSVRPSSFSQTRDKPVCRHPAQRSLLENVSVSVAIQLKQARLLGAVVAIRENDQNLALHFGAEHG